MPDKDKFRGKLKRLHSRFIQYLSTSFEPIPSPGLMVTPEIRIQSEIYIPIKEIKSLFNEIYRLSLHHTPVYSSSPFHGAKSWADCFATLPQWLQITPDPSRLAKALLDDPLLHERFVFYSFMPARFNGEGFGRYPGQIAWIRKWLESYLKENGLLIRCLDAATGSGEGVWEIAALLDEIGVAPDKAEVVGCTLDPLEVWCAKNQSFPHNRSREIIYRGYAVPLLRKGWGGSIRFCTVDMAEEKEISAKLAERYSLILCNGLIGGPILHGTDEMVSLVRKLRTLIMPGGCIAVSGKFHGGWKKKAPESQLRGLFESEGMIVEKAGEGLVALEPYKQATP